jgi:hypothetical protein
VLEVTKLRINVAMGVGGGAGIEAEWPEASNAAAAHLIRRCKAHVLGMTMPIIATNGIEGETYSEAMNREPTSRRCPRGYDLRAT